MFKNLSDRLAHSFQKLRGHGHISGDNIKDSLREVRIALLEADVALSVVQDFVGRVRERGVGQEVLKSLTPGQAFIKVVQDELTTILGDLGTLSASVDQAASDLQASVDAYAASVDLSAAGANTLLSGTSDIFGTVDAAFADFLTTLGAISSSTLDTRLNDVGADFATLTGDFTADFNLASPALAGVDSSFAALATQAQNTTVVATQTSQTVFVEKTVARNNTSPTHVAFGSLGQAGQMTPGVAERAALSRPTAAVADETTEAVADAVAPETTKPVARTAQQIGQSVLEQSGIAAQTYSLNQSLISMLSRSQLSISA